MNKYKFISIAIIALSFCFQLLIAQNKKGQVFDPELNQFIAAKDSVPKERTLRYTPEGQDFVIVNGKNKFNRALYSTNTGFRVETGDVPEFAMYLPRMGGNLSFSIENGHKSISLNEAAYIESRYRAGSRIYNITDPVLGKGNFIITVLPIYDRKGLIIKIVTSNIPDNVNLLWKFGGAADKRFSREGDLGVDPFDCFYLKPEYCKGNIITVDKNSFSLIFGSKKERKLIGTFPSDAQLSIDNSLPVLLGKLKINELQYAQLLDLLQISERKIISTAIMAPPKLSVSDILKTNITFKG